MYKDADSVVIFKDKNTREILTYVNFDGHGASMDIKQFVLLVSELYGSPTSTMTRKRFAEKLMIATDQAIRHMKHATKEIAAINLEPKAD